MPVIAFGKNGKIMYAGNSLFNATASVETVHKKKVSDDDFQEALRIYCELIDGIPEGSLNMYKEADPEMLEEMNKRYGEYLANKEQIKETAKAH